MDAWAKLHAATIAEAEWNAGADARADAGQAVYEDELIHRNPGDVGSMLPLEGPFPIARWAPRTVPSLQPWCGEPAWREGRCDSARASTALRVCGSSPSLSAAVQTLHGKPRRHASVPALNSDGQQPSSSKHQGLDETFWACLVLLLSQVQAVGGGGGSTGSSSVPSHLRAGGQLHKSHHRPAEASHPEADGGGGQEAPHCPHAGPPVPLLPPRGEGQQAPRVGE